MDIALERIRELMPKRRVAAKPDSFFYKFDRSLEADPEKRKTLDDVEADLSCLDEAAWNVLRSQAAKYLLRNPKSGWEPLFNTFNEAKGYRHLRALGCTDIAFVPPRYDRKTPDLKARLDGRTVLCEVKTITTPCTGAKLLKVLTEAKAQLDGFDHDARKVIFIVLGVAATAELETVLKGAPIAGVEVELYICRG